ncbi:MAG: hypothetical protein A2Z25_06150 [Planctomycetes bacterium RBG_16_55_9]|nr:MAG: hypothetical protein A2Z25_06150 [Planctomycetes bacterium RBG_16_55_9]
MDNPESMSTTAVRQIVPALIIYFPYFPSFEATSEALILGGAGLQNAQKKPLPCGGRGKSEIQQGLDD